ncbi:hypothetical protein [Bartonella machadoae]|uniref:hypothetical protein n=1 Tax=Bartonella machadoae TaxID=2893471 RepID=UPI001F4C9463|nr:hypothetical protein [Bartonella machadoae]UNE53719.1 hypothetical protein LNM86_08770 [Bartonella machadoae]
MSNTHYWTSLLGNVVGAVLSALLVGGIAALARGGVFRASKLGQAFLRAGQTLVGRFGKYCGEKASSFLSITKNTPFSHSLKVGIAS